MSSRFAVLMSILACFLDGVVVVCFKAAIFAMMSAYELPSDVL